MRLEPRALTLPLSYRYQLALPAKGSGPLLLCLHGYGQSGRVSLAYGQRIRRDWPIAALQAPHPHHRWQDGARQTGYSWVSDETAEEDVRNHHRFVEEVIVRAHAEGLTPEPKAFLFGFSQAVSLNYRFAAAQPDRVLGLVAVAGAAPSSWQPRRVALPVLHLSMADDAAYPLAKALGFRDALAAFTSELTWLELTGGHRVPREAYGRIRGWLDAQAGSHSGLHKG